MLASLLEPGQLVAARTFRSCTNPQARFRHYIISDHVFLHEPDVVWERLEDIDGGLSTFVDSDFVRSSPVGGDFAGQTPSQRYGQWRLMAHRVMIMQSTSAEP
jgi:hypothetical protein